MKKSIIILILLVFLIFPALIFAQSNDEKKGDLTINWTKTFGGNNNNYGDVILKLGDDYIVGGHIFDKKKQLKKAQLFKINVDGKKTWSEFYPDKKYHSSIKFMIKSVDNNIILAQNISGSKSSKIRLIKVSRNDGTIIWQSDLKIKERVTPQGLSQNSDGEIIIIYDKYESVKSERLKIGITKLDSKGNLLWEKVLESESEESTYAMKPTSDGFMILSDEKTEQKRYFQLVKLNKNGKALWRKRLDGVNYSDYLLEYLAIDSKDNIAVAGNYIGEENSCEALFVLDKEGNQTFSFKDNLILFPKEVRDVTFDQADNILLVGALYQGYYDIQEEGVENEDWDMWIKKIDAKGNPIWEKNYGGSYEDKASSIALTNNGFLVLGYTTYKGSNETDISIIELTENNAAAKVPPKVWALVVGISDYSDSQNKEGWRDLKYCDDDAQKIHDFLQSPAGGSLPTSQIKVLLNSDATQEKVVDAATDLFKQAAPQDLIVFYYSGHGGPNIFAGYDQNISHSDIKKIITQSPAKKRLCIADACYSGTWHNSEVSDRRQLSSDEVNQKYYQFLGRSGDGLALLMSSSSKETSLELGELKQGLFTFYYIEGLSGKADENQDKIITISEIFEYVNKKVSPKASHMGGSQHPQLKGIFDHEMPVGATK